MTNSDGFHDWVIDAFEVASEQIQAGESAQISFVADRIGEYEYYCSVGRHREAGMTGTLRVYGDWHGELSDVSGGDATGRVYVDTTSDYELFARFDDLPDLEAGYFYEGWIVRPEPFDFVSTGALTLDDSGHWIDEFTSDTDYRDYTRYVLTLEPDDGDPAPAEHIVEGDLIISQR